MVKFRMFKIFRLLKKVTYFSVRFKKYMLMQGGRSDKYVIADKI